jgi:CRP-like cAMP-binding protein
MRGVRAVQLSDMSIDNLLPFMSHRFAQAGQVLISKDDKADHMYYLVKGTMRILELGKIIGPGAVLAKLEFLRVIKKEWRQSSASAIASSTR